LRTYKTAYDKLNVCPVVKVPCLFCNITYKLFSHISLYLWLLYLKKNCGLLICNTKMYFYRLWQRSRFFSSILRNFCMTLCCWVVKITIMHSELPETNTNIYICQTRIHLSTCCRHWKIIRQHMLSLILVTYDNIVMCFIR
jgi:hypothetical protein